MKKVLYDPETHSFWSMNVRIQLNEAQWEIFLKEGRQKEETGELKLVNFPELRSHEIETTKRMAAFL